MGTVQTLLAQLQLEQISPDTFAGSPGELAGKGTFGGHVLAQGLLAAGRTVEGRRPHSLHAYFLLPGEAGVPITYAVERIRDGATFATRQVRALQHGRAILIMLASFQPEEPGREHQDPMPQVPPPEQLESMASLHARWTAAAPGLPAPIRALMTQPVPLEVRPVRPWNPLEPTAAPPRQAVWFRTAEPLPEDPALHRALIAYASDFYFIGTTIQPHGLSWLSPGVMLASLDHALWLHREARADQWLLYVMDSPTAQGARGLARGSIYDQRGRLVASTVQEGLMRTPAAAPRT